MDKDLDTIHEELPTYRMADNPIDSTKTPAKDLQGSTYDDLSTPTKKFSSQSTFLTAVKTTRVSRISNFADSEIKRLIKFTPDRASPDYLCDAGRTLRSS